MSLIIKKITTLRRYKALVQRIHAFKVKQKIMVDQHFSKAKILLSSLQEVVQIYVPRHRSIGSVDRSEAVWLQLQNGSENQFREAFRVSKALFNTICNALREKLEPQFNFLSTKVPTSVEKQVAICLYKLASCCEYRVVGNVFGVHKSTVKKFVYRVINAINKSLMKIHIQMPDSEECERISTVFESISGIPQIIGCIDGSHIPIIAPEEGRKDFVNRKGWSSLVLQGVVDDSGKFIDVSCKYPGSCHDSAVFKGSCLFHQINEIIPKKFKCVNGVQIPYLLIGDPAYELQPYMMKDYPGRGLTRTKENFNTSLNSARVKVEIAFGRLKGRWRILLKRSDINYTFMPQVILACCVLHNMIEKDNRYFAPHWKLSDKELNEDYPQPDTEENINRFVNFNGSQIRDALCDHVNK